MSRVSRRNSKTVKARPALATRVAAAEFKATCLELLDRVRETGAEYVVTVSLKAGAQTGPINEPIVLKTNDKANPLVQVDVLGLTGGGRM